ncbi:hypothetical protein [Microbispora sp. NPDC049125]|uniref:hypothetical protein n=1 Tax=Microbispora sp. NPDC049125 TaxID=3154929 RepID=UPI00346637C0
MNHSPDPARPGRLRRLILTAAPPLLILVVPLLLTAVYGGRLPERAYVGSWARFPEYAPTWERWIGTHAYPFAIFTVWYAALFARYWRWPELQRWMAVISLALSVSTAASSAVSLATLIDASGPVPEPAWATPAEVLATLLAGAAAWLLAGPLPAAPVAHATPPAGVPVLALAPGQRAMYAVSTWSGRKLLQGALFLAAAWLGAFNFSDAWQGTALLALTGGLELLQARTLLQIDDRGVELTLPLLGRLRRLVPYATVRFAAVVPRASSSGLGLLGGRRGWGYVSGRLPVLVLKLTDGRDFLYSTRDAESAAALVNATLSRVREEASGADRR